MLEGLPILIHTVSVGQHSDDATVISQMKKVPAKRFQRYLKGTPLQMLQELSGIDVTLPTSQPGTGISQLSAHVSLCLLQPHRMSCPRGCFAHLEGFQSEQVGCVSTS